jgi:uncharacterized membrane protein
MTNFIIGIFTIIAAIGLFVSSAMFTLFDQATGAEGSSGKRNFGMFIEDLLIWVVVMIVFVGIIYILDVRN